MFTLLERFTAISCKLQDIIISSRIINSPIDPIHNFPTPRQHLFNLISDILHQTIIILDIVQFHECILYVGSTLPAVESDLIAC
jgi:hypothetical protein